MCLENMCPEALPQHLETKEGLTSYGAYKPIINDYFANRARWVGKNRLNWMGYPDVGDDEGYENTSREAEVQQVDAMLGQSAALSSVSAEVGAILRRRFVKTPKGTGKRGKGGAAADGGKGKGDVNMDGGKGDKGGKGKGARFESDEEGHIAAECSIRKI